MSKTRINSKEPISWLSSDAYTEAYYRLHMGRYIVQDAHTRKRIYDLFKTVFISEGDLVLDAGCGMGTVSLESYKRGAQVFALDYSNSAIDIAKKFANQLFAPLGEYWKPERIRYIQGSVARIPLSDRSFDVVFAADVVEHLSDGEFEAFIGEAKRVLKANGSLIIYTDNPVNRQPTVRRSKLGRLILRIAQSDSYEVFKKWHIPYTYWTWPLDMINEHDKKWEHVHVGLKDPRYLRHVLLENDYSLDHFEIGRSGTHLDRLPYPANIYWGGMTLIKATIK